MAPKKGKGSKLARMSDEERARYLQHRAAIEEEARRRKQQLIETFIKNKLKKEEAFTRLNVAKINQQWRQTLRVLKCKELQQDLDALHQWFDHSADKKNQLIERLIVDLEEAENQYARVHQCHVDTINKLLSIFNKRISVLQQCFEEKRDEMFAAACNEMEVAAIGAAAEKQHLHAIIFGMEEAFEEENTIKQAAHNTRAEELNNHMLTELENVVNDRGARMEILWSNFQGVLQNHWEQTEDRRREYLNLRHADEENCRHIFKYHQQINNLNENLSQLRNQLNSSSSDESNTLMERKADKDDCMQLFHVLRQKLNAEKSMDRRKLCTLSDIAYSVTKNLNVTVTKGQQILQMMELCKKYEGTDQANGVARHSSAMLKVKDHTETENVEFKHSLAKEAVEEYSILAGFWNKFNATSIEKEALFLQCQVLENEQKQLKSALKKLFSEFSSESPLPAIPLTINRPRSIANDFKSMTLRGKKVTSHTGKADSIYSLEGIGATLMHTLTIELTKS